MICTYDGVIVIIAIVCLVVGWLYGGISMKATIDNED